MIQLYKQGTSSHLYEVLDYIENTLSSNILMSYINTGFRPTYNTRLEFKFFYPANRVIKEMYGGVLSFGCMAWGSSNRTNQDLSFTNIYWLSSGYGSGKTFICGSRIGNNASNYYEWNQYPRFIQDGQDHMLEGTISTSSFNMNVDGTSYSLSPVSSGWTGIDGTVNTVSELYLFTGIWADFQSDPIPPSTAVTSRCYYFKIYENDVLVRNFIPVKRLSDNEIGMYDSVNEIFYGSETQMKFIGQSKSTPEYIDEYSDTTIYVNDIKFNGNSIGRIMLDGDVYWGNDIVPTPPTPPTPTHLLHGTTTLSGSGTFNIGINNTTYNATKNVPVQYDNGEFWLDELPSSIGTITNLVGMFFNLLHVTSIDQFNLDTSQCRSWWTAFGGASIMSFGNISPDLSSCTNLHDTFHKFQGETLDLSRFHVPSTVTDVNGLFYNSPNLKHIDVSNWQLTSLSPQDFWHSMRTNQIVDVTMNNVSQGTFNTFKHALANNSPRQRTAKIYRDGVIYVYRNNSWVVE